MKKYTLKELSIYNGISKQPAYVGYKGKVYDVSAVFKNGEHAGVKAGTDLTDVFGKGPHQEDIFSKLPMIGILTNECSLVEKVFAGYSQKADVILRFALGIIFFVHGAQKLLGWFGGYGWSGTMGFLTQTLNIPAPLAALVILTEFFGGIGIFLGLLTRPAALGISLTMLGAAVKVHLANGFFQEKGGVEYVFILFFVSLYFVVNGAGTISVDTLISRRLKERN